MEEAKAGPLPVAHEARKRARRRRGRSPMEEGLGRSLDSAVMAVDLVGSDVWKIARS
jgi:hypothetical protein